MIQKTLIVIKPDGVARGLVGQILSRFEQRGLKIAAMKMLKVDKEFAKKHYTEDITKRRGEHVRNMLLDYITMGPVVAAVIEGVNAVENVRKVVGPTEGKSALPGTIRGDFSHVSYGYADEKKIPVLNLIHASGSDEEAEFEVNLWFSKKEIHDYKTANHEYIF